MAGIDGLLKLVRQQGADELRLGVDRAPRMFARGAPKRLSVPATPESILRTLLQGILTPECEHDLAVHGRADTSYEVPALGAYRVTFVESSSGFDVVFMETGPAPGPEQRSSRAPDSGDRPTLAPPPAAGYAASSPPPAQAASSRPPGHTAPSTGNGSQRPGPHAGWPEIAGGDAASRAPRPSGPGAPEGAAPPFPQDPATATPTRRDAQTASASDAIGAGRHEGTRDEPRATLAGVSLRAAAHDPEPRDGGHPAPTAVSDRTSSRGPSTAPVSDPALRAAPDETPTDARQDFQTANRRGVQTAHATAASRPDDSHRAPRATATPGNHDLPEPGTPLGARSSPPHGDRSASGDPPSLRPQRQAANVAAVRERSTASGAARRTATAMPDSSAPPTSLEAARLAAWLRRASSLRASDVHLAEGECPCVRVDGALEQLDNAIVEELTSVLPLDTAMLDRLERERSLDLALEIAGAGRVRAHVYTTDSGRVAALRLLPRAAPTFAALSMPCSFDDVVTLPHGLVLVCGPAGAGKSTTLAALAQDALRRRSIVLVTLEDPIEYSMLASATSLVRRRQIGRDARDFASGLRDALRADPDVLLIGELRDRETIALALTAAETGHLVLASVHSRSTASAIERIVDGFAGDQQQQVRIQLSEALRVVVAQRLVRRRVGDGRLPAIEVLRVNRAVASLIREGKTAQIASVLQSSKREGMLALERCLADRVQAGEIDDAEAFAAANDTEALAQFLNRRAP